MAILHSGNTEPHLSFVEEAFDVASIFVFRQEAHD